MSGEISTLTESPAGPIFVQRMPLPVFLPDLGCGPAIAGLPLSHEATYRLAPYRRHQHVPKSLSLLLSLLACALICEVADVT
jgi:hypothetical protein